MLGVKVVKVVKGVIAHWGELVVIVNSQRSAYLSEERRVKSEKSNSLVAISLWVRIHKTFDFFRCAQGATPSSPQWAITPLTTLTPNQNPQGT